MASLCSDSGKRGETYRVISRSKNGKRHTIRLGRVNKRIAETARLMIESLEAAKATGHSPDRETAEWVGRLGDEIHGRLARAGLVSPREPAQPAIVTLGQHLEQFFGSLGKQKPTTARNYARARRLLAVNPFADVPCGPQTNDARIFYVSVEIIEKVIAVCPDNDWRLIFALPRYGGARFPSEVEDLKWSDIDWEKSVFTVHEKKVEHHPGRRSDDLDRNPEITEKAIDVWIGNSERIRRRHYHGVRPEDWAAATGKAAQIPARPASFRSVQEPSTLHDARKKSLDIVKDTDTQYPRLGSNQ